MRGSNKANGPPSSKPPTASHPSRRGRDLEDRVPPSNANGGQGKKELPKHAQGAKAREPRPTDTPKDTPKARRAAARPKVNPIRTRAPDRSAHRGGGAL